MSRKIILICCFLACAGLARGLTLSGNLDLSGQYNTNFIETDLYDEAQNLLTGEADSITRIKFNLGAEHNPTEKSYLKLEYTLETKGYNKNAILDSNDHTLAFQFDQRLNEETALGINISAQKHNEENVLKRGLAERLLLKGTRDLNPALNFELSFSSDQKISDDNSPRNYFAYMSYARTEWVAKFRSELHSDLIAGLKVIQDSKQYNQSASNSLRAAFPVLNQSYRTDQTLSIELNFIKVIDENALANFILAQTNSQSNISFYQFGGLTGAIDLFGHFWGNRLELRCDLGNFNYPNRFGIGFSGENLSSNKYSFSFQREIRGNLFLNLAWEGIRNSSNNPINNFNNDEYTIGFNLNGFITGKNN